jgi:hypothetical protein
MAASKWHKITNITDDDLAGSLTDLGGYVFKECNIDLDGDAAVTTEIFDFPVEGDLTIVVNTNAKDITNDYVGANCKISVEGSVDNTSWAVLDTSATLAIDTLSDVHVYDYDAKGRLPYMRLSLIGHDAATHASEAIKLAVINH